MSTHGSDWDTARLAPKRSTFNASMEFTVLLQSTSPNGGTFVGSTIDMTGALTALVKRAASTDAGVRVSDPGVTACTEEACDPLTNGVLDADAGVRGSEPGVSTCADAACEPFTYGVLLADAGVRVLLATGAAATTAAREAVTVPAFDGEANDRN